MKQQRNEAILKDALEEYKKIVGSLSVLESRELEVLTNIAIQKTITDVLKVIDEEIDWYKLYGKLTDIICDTEEFKNADVDTRIKIIFPIEFNRLIREHLKSSLKKLEATTK